MRRLLLLALLVLVAGPTVAQTSDDYVRVPFNVSLWRGISLGDAIAKDTSERVLHHVSLNLPHGQADRLEGVAVGVFGTVYEESAYGVQVAGLANVAGEDAGAIQVAGLANVVGEDMKGIQVSGLANVVGERGGFVQAAGLANIAGEAFQGVQASGLANITGETTTGVQASGLANIAGESMLGIQSAGLANIVGEGMHGVQSAGLANIVGEDLVGIQGAVFNVVGGKLRGMQLGVVNVAAESAGLQLGFVNVAGEQRGVPVGLYSRTDGVPVRLDVWTDETAALHVGVRSGSATITNYAGVSVRPVSGAAFRWGVFAGLGVVRSLGTRSSGEIDLFVHGLFAEDFGDVGGGLVRLRATLARALNDRVAVFGGPALSLFLSDTYDGDDLAPFSIYDRQPAPGEGGTFVRLWPGLEAGLRIHLSKLKQFK